jgi:hypothetical protein
MKTPVPLAPEAIPDDLVLAAVERAERHRERRGAPLYLIKEHLAAPKRSGRARRANALVLTLAEAGLLEHFREHSMDFWTLSDSARRRLRRAKGVAESLPESPQHERWRAAHTLAERELDGYRERLRAVLAETTALLDAASEGATASEEWFELGRRLDRHMRRVGAATHCLHEWQEPTDDVADMEGHRERGRRSYRSWRFVDEEDAREEEAESLRRPDLSVRAMLARHGERRLSSEEFDQDFGQLPTDGEG